MKINFNIPSYNNKKSNKQLTEFNFLNELRYACVLFLFSNFNYMTRV